jgi:cob(I)alamin adenosyltransferase
MKIYTKTGDDGTTGLQGGIRVDKSNPRIIAYGTVDELNSNLGVVLSENTDEQIKQILTQIQNELFILGSDLSNPDNNDTSNRISQERIKHLEDIIDELEKEVKPLTNFILPGGTKIAALIHQARTVARRAEICVVELQKTQKINNFCLQYLNRLSDLLFVLGRVMNKRNNSEDVIWKPKKDTL